MKKQNQTKKKSKKLINVHLVRAVLGSVDVVFFSNFILFN